MRWHSFVCSPTKSHCARSCATVFQGCARSCATVFQGCARSCANRFSRGARQRFPAPIPGAPAHPQGHPGLTPRQGLCLRLGSLLSAPTGFGLTVPFLPAQGSLPPGHVVRANGPDPKFGPQCVGETEVFTDIVGLVQGPAAFGRLDDVRGLRGGEAEPAHPTGGLGHGKDRVLEIDRWGVPEPYLEQPVKVSGIVHAGVLGDLDELAAPDAMHTSMVATLAHDARSPPDDLANAIWRERTQDRTSGVGGIGSGERPQGGNRPNFSLNLWLTQPGL
jgi:hypothetical protein